MLERNIWKTSLQCWDFERIFFCFKYHKIQISRFTKRIIFSPTKIQEYFSIKLKGPFQSRKYWWFCFSPLLKSHTVASALFFWKLYVVGVHSGSFEIKKYKKYLIWWQQKLDDLILHLFSIFRNKIWYWIIRRYLSFFCHLSAIHVMKKGAQSFWKFYDLFAAPFWIQITHSVLRALSKILLYFPSTTSSINRIFYLYYYWWGIHNR